MQKWANLEISSPSKTKATDNSAINALQMIDTMYHDTTAKITNIKNCIKTFNDSYEHSFTKAAAQLHTVIDKFSYFKGTQDQYMQTYGTRCAQKCTYHETKFKTNITTLLSDRKETLHDGITTHIHHIIEDMIKPTLATHIEELDNTITNVITKIEILQQHCMENIQTSVHQQNDCQEHQNPQWQQKPVIPPHHWNNQPVNSPHQQVPSPTKSTPKTPGHVNWGIPLS
jgi:hypothetical protein